MPSDNLFSPAFGGLPQVFFGRTDELSFALDALDNENSPRRAFFITGNRGCGKTTLLEKISSLAAKHGWMTIDIHSSHVCQSVMEALAGGTQKTIEKSASPSAMGVSLGRFSSTVTTSFTEASLSNLLVEKCSSLKGRSGVLITIDEIQKVREDDAENLCAAAQIALRKGLPLMLILAGLPGSKEKVASYPGCTFMQRAYDMKLSSLQVNETLEAFRGVFHRMPRWDIEDEAIWRLGVFSQGYPYLMQLAGYYAVERARESLTEDRSPIAISEDMVRAIEPVALAEYRANVLEPILNPLSEGLSSYLHAMCEVDSKDGRISTGDVARRLGKSPMQVSVYRSRLIDRRLIEADGRGYVRFLLPHVKEYYFDKVVPLEQKDPLQQWNRYEP